MKTSVDQSTPLTYTQDVTCVEYAPFAKRVNDLLDEAGYLALQVELMQRPEVGVVIVNGGLRKVRWVNTGKGKSGGVRVIYY